MIRDRDEGNELTEERLAQLERRIARLYREARDELDETVVEYFAAFRKRDVEMQERVEAGEVSKEDYIQWRLAQIGRGKRFEIMRDQVAERYTKANEIAVSYVNDETPGIYSLNRNYTAYTLEQSGAAVDFTLFDEQTVRRLAVEEPELMPYYPPRRALQRGIDLKYGKTQITAAVTSSILRGRSIPQIADDLQTRMENMSRASAIRTARTAITGAQNAGRQDGFDAAAKMGIRLQKEWLATLDNRTRHSHGMLDGERIALGAKFPNGCRFPGDPQGPGHEVYNCRCTMIASLSDVDTSDAVRWAKDPETGERARADQRTYREWIAGKQAVQKAKTQVAAAPKSAIMEKKGGEDVQEIAKIDIEKYQKAANERIRTADVVLTDNQREHIIQRRGQEFYDRYSRYFKEIAEDPDYIFADHKHENTAIASKTIRVEGKNIHLVLRLIVEGDEEHLKNSIITAMVEGDKRYHQRLRNNNPLYKKE